jgi:hypothetical protein
MDIHILSEHDVYKICYLTMNGWKHSEGAWIKKGIVRPLSADEQEDNKYYMKHHNYNKYDGHDFSLDQAFELQMSLNESF